MLESHDLGDGLSFLTGLLPAELIWSEPTFAEVWELHPSPVVVEHRRLLRQPEVRGMRASRQNCRVSISSSWRQKNTTGLRARTARGVGVGSVYRGAGSERA